ncbi:hypothetical protein Dimus_035341, partial [Dionaea muscipula]
MDITSCFNCHHPRRRRLRLRVEMEATGGFLFHHPRRHRLLLGGRGSEDMAFRWAKGRRLGSCWSSAPMAAPPVDCRRQHGVGSDSLA